MPVRHARLCKCVTLVHHILRAWCITTTGDTTGAPGRGAAQRYQQRHTRTGKGEAVLTRQWGVNGAQVRVLSRDALLARGAALVHGLGGPQAGHGGLGAH